MSDVQSQGTEGELYGTTYTIGDLAREFDITTRTIRYYELEGLLSPVRIGTQRLYRRRDRTRLKLILRSKRLGFTLAEMRELFDLYEQAHGQSQQLRHYLAVLNEKRQQLIRQREDLEESLRELDQSYAHCQQLLEQQEQEQAETPAPPTVER
jgi:DNA-binding transcriptional MerR regulator